MVVCSCSCIKPLSFPNQRGLSPGSEMYLSGSEVEWGLTVCRGCRADAFSPGSDVCRQFGRVPPRASHFSCGPEERSFVTVLLTRGSNGSLLQEPPRVGGVRGSLSSRTSAGCRGMPVLEVSLVCDPCTGVLHVPQTQGMLLSH